MVLIYSVSGSREDMRQDNWGASNRAMICGQVGDIIIRFVEGKEHCWATTRGAAHDNRACHPSWAQREKVYNLFLVAIHSPGGTTVLNYVRRKSNPHSYAHADLQSMVYFSRKTFGRGRTEHFLQYNQCLGYSNPYTGSM